MSWVTSRQMSQSESVLKPAAMISDSFGTWAMTTFLRSLSHRRISAEVNRDLSSRSSMRLMKGKAMSTTAKVPPAKLARIVEWTRHHLYRLHQRLTPAPAAMIEMIIAGWTSQAITVAAQLGVADALANGPLPIDELAVRVGADADALRRLLRALISRGIFRHRRDGRYELNSLADTLRFDAPVSMTWAARFYGSQEQRERWTLLVDAVRTGNSIVPALRGKSSFDYFADEPELAELFNQTMTSVSEMTDATRGRRLRLQRLPARSSTSAAGTAHCWPPSSQRRRLRGASCTTCRRSSRTPRACCASTMSPTGFVSPRGRSSTAFRAVVTPTSSRTSSTTGQTRRRCKSSVTFARQAGPRATVLLIEFVIPKHDRDFPGKWVDLEMLLNLGARERTAVEYRDLLGEAGFRMTRVVQTASPLSVVEASAA